jgi:hypothetical protein
MDGKMLQGLIMFKSWVDQELCQGGNGKRDVKMAENITTENLTKEIMVATSDSASKNGVFRGAFLWSRCHRVEQFCFLIAERGSGLGCKGGLMFGGCLPGMTLENSSKVGFSQDLDVNGWLENIILIVRSKKPLEGDGNHGFA